MALTLTITAAGRAALVNAAHNGTAPVQIAAVGVSAQALTTTPATAALPGEIKRIATLSGDVVAADTIHLIVRDETDASYTVRSLALYLADGTLFGAYGQTDVIVEKSVQALLLLAIDVRFADITAAQISFGNANFLNPPATTDRVGVVELATPDEARGGSDAIRAVTPATAKAAVRDWIGYTPANRAGDDFAGPVSFATPNAGTTGGLRLRSNAASGYAYLQVTNADLSSEWGNLQFDAAGRMRWSGNLSVLGTILRAGNPVWDAGNDGAGSGLDGDLLDGQQGAWYADIPARLGFSPANRAGDDFAGSVSVATPNTGTTGGLRLRSNAASGYAYLQVTNADLSSEWGNLQFDAAGRMRWSGNLAVLGSILRAGNLVWDAGNDGAGSGLDGDLLDGQQGAWYADIPARLGFQPANVAGQAFSGDISAPRLILTANGDGRGIAMGDDAWIGDIDRGAAISIRGQKDPASGYILFGSNGQGLGSQAGGALTYGGQLVWHAGNDGAGSGLDGDLLDGQQGAWYADVPARLGFQPANVAGQAFSGDIAAPRLILTANGDGRGIAVGDDAWIGDIDRDSAISIRGQKDPASGYILFGSNGQGLGSQAGGALTYGGQPVWHAANDGAGSGLDADLFDGHDSSVFARITGSGSNANGSWRTYADGRVEMEGLLAIGSGSNAIATRLDFPVAFPTECSGITGNADGPANPNWQPITVAFQNRSRTTADCLTDTANTNQQIAAGRRIMWRAWGR